MPNQPSGGWALIKVRIRFINMRINETIRLIDVLAGPVIVLAGLGAAVAIPRSTEISLSAMAGGLAYMTKSSAKSDDDDRYNKEPYLLSQPQPAPSLTERVPLMEEFISPVSYSPPNIGGNKLGVTEEDLDNYSDLP